MWVPAPADWHENIVTGAGYDPSSAEGRRIWQDCLSRAAALGPPIPYAAVLATDIRHSDETPRYGSEQLVRPRLGQGTFRFAVQNAYGKSAVTCVTPDYRFHVSPRLERDYHNGKVYYQLEGTELWLPQKVEDRPRREHLERHNDEVFLAK